MRQQVVDRVAQVVGIVGLDVPAGGQRAERSGKLWRGEEAWWWRGGSGAPVTHDVGLAGRPAADDGLPIAIASRIVVMPAWKSVSTEWHDDERRVGVQLAQLLVVVGADRDVRGQLRRRAESVVARPVARRADAHVHVEVARGGDQRRVVAELQPGAADHRTWG